MRKLVVMLLIITFGFTFTLKSNASAATNDGLTFNGSNYVNIGNGEQYNQLDQMTVEARVKLSSLDSEQHIVSKTENGGYCLHYNIAHHTFAFSVYVNGSYHYVYADETPKINQWYNLSATYDGQQVKLYVNGKQQKDINVVPGAIGISPKTPLTIGQNPRPNGDIGTSLLDGDVSMARVWNRALSQNDIVFNINHDVKGNEKGLIGYWILDPITTKKVYNKSSLMEDLSLNGTSEKSSEPAKGLELNGESTFVNLGNGTQYDDFNEITIESTFSLNSTKEQAIVAKVQSGGYQLAVDDGGYFILMIYINGSYHKIRSDSPAVPGERYHLTGVYDGSQMRLYLNGVEQKEKLSISGKIKSIPDVPLTIGMNPNREGTLSSYILDGRISEARIWDRALSTTEIKDLQNKQLTGNEKGLVGYWTPDSITTKEVYDKTSGTDGIAYGYQPAIKLSTTASDIDVSLQWNALRDATGYHITRNGQVVYQGGQNEFKDAPLLSDTDYTYEIYPYSSNGVGLSSTQKAKTLKGSLQLTSVPSSSTIKPITLNGKHQNSTGSFDGSLVIKDTRKSSDGWHITVNGKELKDGSGNVLPKGSLILSPIMIKPLSVLSSLPKAMVGSFSLDDQTQKTLVSAKANEGQGIYQIEFSKEPVKLSINPGNAFSDNDSIYKSDITWTLVSGP